MRQGGRAEPATPPVIAFIEGKSKHNYWFLGRTPKNQ
jgi:hypothetical protein